MTKKEIDLQILGIIDFLEYTKVIPNPSACLDEIGCPRQSLTKIKNGTQHFTTQHIAKLCKVYNVNANYIFRIQTNKFNIA